MMYVNYIIISYSDKKFNILFYKSYYSNYLFTVHSNFLIFSFLFNLGLRVDQIQECILWMTPFALAIRDEGFDLLRLHKHEQIEKMPNIQVHSVDLKLLVSLYIFI